MSSKVMVKIRFSSKLIVNFIGYEVQYVSRMSENISTEILGLKYQILSNIRIYV